VGYQKPVQTTLPLTQQKPSLKQIRLVLKKASSRIICFTVILFYEL
jgi:hypothetical protein